MRESMIASLLAAAAIAASPAPAPGTPSLIPHSGPQTAVIRQLRECGGTIYAAGEFAVIRSHGRDYSRHGAFSFSARAPYRLTRWNPGIRGQVNSIVVADHCGRAWLATGHGITEVTVPGGRRVAGFRSAVHGTVNTLLDWHGHLLAGGQFPGSLASLNLATGRYDGFTDGVDIHGNMPPGHYSTMVYNSQLSPNGKRLLIEGDFTRAGHMARPQIFMLNLDHRPAQVTPWRSPEFGGQCIKHESFYVRSAAWGSNRIYIADTGDHALDWNGHGPQTGLCDAVAAFPADWGSVSHIWRNFFGCDSAYAAGYADGTVFAAGHFRWVQNRDGCNHAGPQSVPDEGLAGYTTAGAPLLSNGKARYTMSRANADDMLVTGGKLWIASTNRFGSDRCDGVSGHSGICAIPLG
jgi:hypothetical protein